MYQARKTVMKHHTEALSILKHMGYSAYKLWNVGNYEKRNHKTLGFEKFPNWYDQKKRLKDNFFYKNLPSQTAQDVLQQLQEAWNSFFVLKKNNSIANPKPPRFKHAEMNVTFLKDAIHQDKEKNIIRLTISKQLKDYLKTIEINATYIYLNTDRYSDVDIKELQVTFIDDETFAIIGVYETEETNTKDNNQKYLSIDLGINNNFTCFDSTTGACFILNNLLNITHYYEKKIAYYQSISDQQQILNGIKYPKKSKRVLNLYTKKKNSINDFIHKSTRYITDYCIKNNIHTVVIGDITNIRKDKNIGRSNQQLHSFPYKKIYDKLAYKLAMNGISLEYQNESYSSQCSPNTPMVSKAYADKNKRVRRGLYKENNCIYNSDAVGAYNILRLFLHKNNFNVLPYENLSSVQKVFV